MAFLEENEIETIRSNTNIVDIISSYLPLTQKGKNYFGVCPFHDDHSPSMSVSTERQIYKCFSCGAAGNVFTFVENYENVSFIESVKIVAEKIGYHVAISNTTKNTKNSNLYKTMDLALKFYKNNLNTKEGLEAKKYLEKRHLNETIINDFEVGLSLNKTDSLYKLLNNKGVPSDDLKRLGLINIDGARIYDSFQNRIIFPIHNLDGQAIGFTGRIYHNEDTAKYYNSRETDIFKKGQILFNYHRAKEYIKDKHEVILVEGNMDAIRLYGNGFKNVVALMGTTMTKEQIEILKKLRSKVILMLDNDDAGEIATLNNGQALENSNIEVSVVRLSDYKDPDDYLVNYGPEKMETIIKNQMSFLDFKLFYYKKSKNLNNTNDLVLFVKDIINSMKDIKDNLTKELTLKKLSEDYNIPIDILKNEVLLEVKESQPKEKPVLIKPSTKYDKTCEAIIYYMMSNSLYINIYHNNNLFIDNKTYRNIINEILYYYEKYNTINLADFISYTSFKEELNKEILNIIANKDEDLNENNFSQYLKAINDMNINNKIKHIKEEMKNTVDINKKAELANKLIELKKGSVDNERN